MQTFTYLLMGFLVVCAVSVSFSRNLLNSILIFMSYSLVMSIIWILLESPGSGNYGSGCGGRGYQRAFLCDAEKDPCYPEGGRRR